MFLPGALWTDIEDQEQKFRCMLNVDVSIESARGLCKPWKSKSLRAKALAQRGQVGAELDLTSVEARCTAKEPHICTATMASGYGLAGGTYPHLI